MTSSDLAFGAHTTLGYSPNSNQTGGTLTVGDGSHAASIALLGNYIASSFAIAGDSNGGTMVVAEMSQSGSQSLLTQSSARVRAEGSAIEQAGSEHNRELGA